MGILLGESKLPGDLIQRKPFHNHLILNLILVKDQISEPGILRTLMRAPSPSAREFLTISALSPS